MAACAGLVQRARLWNEVPHATKTEVKLASNLRKAQRAAGICTRAIAIASIAAFGFTVVAAAQGNAGRVASLLSEAQQNLDAGNFAAAAARFEEARKLAPQNKAAWRGSLLAHLQGKQLPAAVRLGKQAVAQWPQDAEFQHLLGLAYFQSGASDSAIPHLQTAEKLAPGRYDILFDSALVYLSRNEYGSAAVQLEKALKVKSNEALPHLLLGRAYHNTNRTLQAVAEFKKALQIDPRIQLAHYHLGFAYESLGRNTDAIVEFRKELSAGRPHPQVLYRLGHALLDSGEPAEAVKHLRQSVQLAADNAEAHYDLGKALLALGKPADAIEPLKRASALKSDDSRFPYQLARAYEKLGQKDLAQEQWQRFATLKASQPATGGMAHKPNQ